MPKSSRIPKGRDSSLDLLRGLAALNIIFIHTTFWSGEAYVPEALKSISLAVDVSFFFFLSGWSLGYVRSLKKNLMSLINTYLKYLVFLAFYFALLLIIREVSGMAEGLTLENLLANLRFQVAWNTALPVVMSSMWFMEVYYVVVPIAMLLRWAACQLSGGSEKWTTVLLGGALAADLAGLVYTWRGGSIPLLSQVTLFYLAFVLLGLMCRGAVIPRLSWALGLMAADAVLMVLTARRLGMDWRRVQDMKFPPNAVYLCYSLLAIIAALWLRGKLSSVSPQNPLCQVGRAALVFYFCQGIGGSLLMVLLPKIQLVWYAKLPLAYVINVMVTVVFVCLLSTLYWLVFQFLPKLLGGSRERL